MMETTGARPGAEAPAAPGDLRSLLLIARRGHVGDEAAGGLFLLCFALGWAGITLLSAFFTARTAWWPLIAGGVIAALGGLALLGGSGRGVLAAIGGPVVPVLALGRDRWPLGLIAVGLSLILRRGRARA